MYSILEACLTHTTFPKSKPFLLMNGWIQPSCRYTHGLHKATRNCSCSNYLLRIMDPGLNKFLSDVSMVPKLGIVPRTVLYQLSCRYFL